MIARPDHLDTQSGIGAGGSVFGRLEIGRLEIGRWAAAAAVSLAVHGGLLGAVLLWEQRFEPPRPPAVFTVDVVIEALPGGGEQQDNEHTRAQAGRQSAPADDVAGEPAVVETPLPPPPEEVLGARVEPTPVAAKAPSSEPLADKAVFAPRPKLKPVLTPPPIAKKGILQPAPAAEPADRPPSEMSNKPPPQSARLADEIAPAGSVPSDESKGVTATAAANAALLPPTFAQPGRGNPLPRYPRAARRHGLEGTLVLRVAVDEAGRPGRLEVIESSGHSMLDRAAMEAVSRWHFRPGRRGGKPVKATVDVPVVFRLQASR